MPEITETDAVRIASEYYGRRFSEEDTLRLLCILIKVDVFGLIAYVYNSAVNDTLADPKH